MGVWGGEVQSRGLVGVFWGTGEPPRDPPQLFHPHGWVGERLCPSIHPCPPHQQLRGMLWGGGTGAGSHPWGPGGFPPPFPSTDGQNPSAGDAPGVPRTPVPPLPCTLPICPPPQNPKEGNEGWEKPTPILPPLGPAPSPSFPAKLWGHGCRDLPGISLSSPPPANLIKSHSDSFERKCHPSTQLHFN